MVWMARIAVALVGLFSLVMAAQAVAMPDRLGAMLGLGAIAPVGIHTLRADIGAFFLASAVACGGALFAGRVQWLWGAVLLYGSVAALRLLSLLLSGGGEGVVEPIVVELVLVALAVFGARALPGGAPGNRAA